LKPEDIKSVFPSVKDYTNDPSDLEGLSINFSLNYLLELARKTD